MRSAPSLGLPRLYSFGGTSPVSTALNRPAFELNERRAKAAPREPAFYADPYAFYDVVHAQSPAFQWTDYGHWCFAGFKEVNALLRDRRFDRQILHKMTREQLGMPPPKPHTAAFDLTEKYSLLTLEPPDHTRLQDAGEPGLRVAKCRAVARPHRASRPMR